MRKFLMRDVSTGSVSREDTNVSLPDALHMTDFSEEEMNELVDLQVGQIMTLDKGNVYIERTA